MTHYDEDGDDITLTEVDRIQLQDELAGLDVLLDGYQEAAKRQEWQRRRNHIANELQAGHFLPIEDEDA